MKLIVSLLILTIELSICFRPLKINRVLDNKSKIYHAESLLFAKKKNVKNLVSEEFLSTLEELDTSPEDISAKPLVQPPSAPAATVSPEAPKKDKKMSKEEKKKLMFGLAGNHLLNVF